MSEYINTPFGTLKIYANGEIINYLPIITRFEHPVCKDRPLAGCYRILGEIERNQTVKCIIEPLPSCEVYDDSGENYICQNFVKDNFQLTIGTTEYYDSDIKPYEINLIPNGLMFTGISEKATIELGVAWVNDLSDDDLRTWFAADPSYYSNDKI